MISDTCQFHKSQIMAYSDQTEETLHDETIEQAVTESTQNAINQYITPILHAHLKEMEDKAQTLMANTAQKISFTANTTQTPTPIQQPLPPTPWSKRSDTTTPVPQPPTTTPYREHWGQSQAATQERTQSVIHHVQTLMDSWGKDGLNPFMNSKNYLKP